MHDLTLIIATRDRARSLAALLSYLETEKTDCQLVVLDSSRSDALAINRARVARSSLDVDFVEFREVDSGEMYQQGIRRALTPFCAVCSDEDLIVLEGVQHCLNALRTNPVASLAHGYSFSFLPRPDGNMELNEMHFGSQIEADSPLERLAKLCARYQPLKCGVFRTPALQRIFDTLGPLTKALTRDLLWSALAVIGGQPLFQPHFSYGHRTRPVDPSNHTHLLQWLCKDPESLFAEYLHYREILASAVTRRPDNDLEPNEVPELLDLMHLRYLLQQVPDSDLEYITEQQAGIAFANYWPRGKVDLPLCAHISSGTSLRAPGSGPLTIQGRERSYLLSSNFYAPPDMASPPLNRVIRVLAALENYRPPFEMEPDASAAR
jgi:glycosyltransferase domain-containing protein